MTEPTIAIILVTLGLLYLNIQYTKTTKPNTETSFENHKKRYIEEEKREVTQTLNKIVATSNSPKYLLPDIQDKVVQVQVGDKWVQVVDVKFLEIGTTNKNNT